jgi:hypothetical protein
MTSPPPSNASRPEASDREVLAWARRRGLVTLGIFALVALVFFVVWSFAR